MKLSEKLSNYRADRPDEYTMDEFKRNALELEQQLQQYKSIVKTVDADNLPNWEVLGFNEKDNNFLLGELVSEEDGVYIYYDMTDYMLITHYIEQKDLIEMISGGVITQKIEVEESKHICQGCGGTGFSGGCDHCIPY